MEKILFLMQMILSLLLYLGQFEFTYHLVIQSVIVNEDID